MRWGIDDKVNPNAQLKVPSYAPLPLLQVTQVAAGGLAEPVATLVQSGKLALWGLNSGKVSSVPTARHRSRPGTWTSPPTAPALNGLSAPRQASRSAA